MAGGGVMVAPPPGGALRPASPDSTGQRLGRGLGSALASALLGLGPQPLLAAAPLALPLLLALAPAAQAQTTPVVSLSLPSIEGVPRRAGRSLYPEADSPGPSFRISFSPRTGADELTVCLRISETGPDRLPAASEGVKTVTIPASTLTHVYLLNAWPNPPDPDPDQPDSEVTVTVLTPSDSSCSGSGYTVSATNYVNTFIIQDDDPTTVTLAGAAGDVEEGGTKTFTVSLGRGLVNGETLPVPLTFGGGATRGTDYMVTCPTTLPTGVTCNNLNTAATPTVTFTGPTTGTTATSVTLTLSAATDSAVESSGETVDIGLGALTSSSGTGLGGGAAGTDSLATFTIHDPLTVRILRQNTLVFEGTDARFRVTASRAVSANLTVNLTVEDVPNADFVSSANEGSQTVTIASGASTADFDVPIEDDATDEPGGDLTVRVRSGTGYTPASTPQNRDFVTVGDDDATEVTLSVPDATAAEGSSTDRATVRLSLPRPLRTDESVAIPLAFSGGVLGTATLPVTLP